MGREESSYLTIECFDMIDQSFAAELCVVAEQDHHPTTGGHFTLVQQAAVQDAVIIIGNGNVIQFSLNLQTTK